MSVARRLFVLITSSLMLATALPSPVGASESSVYAGACAMTMTASFSPGLTRTPTAQTINFFGTGLCQVNTSILASGGFAAGVTALSPGMSCSAGVATGLGSFSLTGTPPLPSVSNGATVVVNAGGTFVIAFSWQIYRFVAVGTFAPADTSPALCLAGTPQTSTSLVGAFAIEDPTLPVEG